jgi:hypothetical protein
MTFAWIRRDILDQGFIPPTSPALTEQEMISLFKVISKDDFETKEGYNLVIENLQTGRAFLAWSIDFEFK